MKGLASIGSALVFRLLFAIRFIGNCVFYPLQVVNLRQFLFQVTWVLWHVRFIIGTPSVRLSFICIVIVFEWLSRLCWQGFSTEKIQRFFSIKYTIFYLKIRIYEEWLMTRVFITKCTKAYCNYTIYLCIFSFIMKFDSFWYHVKRIHGFYKQMGHD